MFWTLCPEVPLSAAPAPPGSAALSQEPGRSLGSCLGLFGFRFILQILRAGSQQVIDFSTGEPIHKGDRHIPIEQQALAGIAMGDVGELVLEKISEQQLEDTENLTVHLLSLQEVKELLQQGSIRQALMAAPLWKYMAERII